MQTIYPQKIPAGKAGIFAKKTAQTHRLIVRAGRARVIHTLVSRRWRLAYTGAMPPKVATGALKSPVDYRDKIAAAAAIAAQPTITLPTTFHTDLGSVLMQSIEPACVAHNMVYIFRYWWFLKYGVWVDFSPRFLDTLVKRYDGQPIDGGTFPRLVLNVLCQFGCATTATLPNDTSLPIATYRDDALLTAAVMSEASKYKAPGYYGVPLDMQSTREAIFLYGAISALFQIGPRFYTSAAGQASWLDADIDPLDPPASEADVISGHQLAPNGWGDSIFNTLRNEWSSLWANNGEARYSPQGWAQFILEQWAIAEIPKDVVDFLKVLPSPANFHYTFQKNMHRGDESTDVEFLQIAYMILGLLEPIQPSEFGYFGPKTAEANLKYQNSKNIQSPSANDAGPQTRGFLNGDFAV